MFYKIHIEMHEVELKVLKCALREHGGPICQNLLDLISYQEETQNENRENNKNTKAS